MSRTRRVSWERANMRTRVRASRPTPGASPNVRWAENDGPCALCPAGISAGQSVLRWNDDEWVHTACAEKLIESDDPMKGRIQHKGLRDLASLARRQGWEVTYTGGGHLKWKPPEGQHIITSSTPDTIQSFDNSKKDLERAGLIVTEAAFRAARKAERPDTGGQDVPDPFCCRSEGCRERFESQFLRDKHESEFHVTFDNKEPCPVPGCTRSVLRSNLPAHVKTTHGKDGWTWRRGSRKRPGEAIPPSTFAALDAEDGGWEEATKGTTSPSVSVQDDNDALIDLMVETVFPQGLPLRNPAVLRALADFSEAANKFLDAAKEATR